MSALSRAFSTPVDGGEIAKVRRPPHPDPRLTHNSNGRRSRRRPIHRLVDALVPLPSFAHNRSPNKDLASPPQSPMDAAGLEDPDPSLAHGHRVFFEREVPFELRAAEGVEEPQEVGSLEAIKVKVLAIGPKDGGRGGAESRRDAAAPRDAHPSSRHGLCNAERGRCSMFAFSLYSGRRASDDTNA